MSHPQFLTVQNGGKKNVFTLLESKQVKKNIKNKKYMHKKTVRKKFLCKFRLHHGHNDDTYIFILIKFQLAQIAKINKKNACKKHTLGLKRLKGFC